MSQATLSNSRHPAVSRDRHQHVRPALDRDRIIGWLPTILTVGMVAAIAALFFLSDSFRSETGRAIDVLTSGEGEAIRAYLLSFGIWAPVISLALMLLQAVITPIPSVLIVFANGLTFGPLLGGVLSLAGQTLAACACFWFARSVGRRPVEALAGKFGVNWFDRWFERWGVAGILVSRMIPGVSFDAVSYASGLSPVKFWRFLVATMAGIAPQSFAYAWLIHHSPQHAWMLLAGSVTIAGLVGLVMLIRRRRNGEVVS
jgi:uncharacterized membrane protein YdjX (TVP38/TMEM64 family)